ncbi:PREDICTED: peroxisomal membrane protein PEX14-like, partial [Priapulus caudatus]|uniref:Peroxisomal membrane protein PEX14 n=1 Tax=Priapulus caudatus TaxID=37621 RepID=A0ABM1EWK6_PRICU
SVLVKYKEQVIANSCNCPLVTCHDRHQRKYYCGLPHYAADSHFLRVATAVKFLQNPRVQQSSLNQRKTFLIKKGLTELEVKTALQRSGLENIQTSSSGNGISAVVPLNAHMQDRLAPAVSQPAVRHKRLSDYAVFIVLGASASYSVYWLIEKYVAPYLRGKLSHQEEQLIVIDKKVTELEASVSESMGQLQETLKTMQDVILRQQQQLQQLCSSSTSSIVQPVVLEQQFGDIKTEIMSLKGILLNRKQFAAVPSPTPLIPAWQLPQQDNIVAESVDNCVPTNQGQSFSENNSTTTSQVNGEEHSTETSSSSIANVESNVGVKVDPNANVGVNVVEGAV